MPGVQRCEVLRVDRGTLDGPRPGQRVMTVATPFYLSKPQSPARGLS